MNVETAQFGIIEAQEEKIIYFKGGLPGFESLKKYVLLSPPDLDPIHLLQSTEDKNTALTLASPFLFKGDYSPTLGEGVLKDLEIERQDQAAIFVVLVIPKEYSKMTANLMAPIVINAEKRMGKQVILDEEDYPVRYPIFQNPDGQVG